jgi:RNA polymerase sigma factor FliA
VTQNNSKSAKQERSDAVLELWQTYKSSGDPRARERLVLTLAPLVKYIVFQKAKQMPAQCEVQDLISAGLEAVLRSLDRYDPEKGATLEQFVWIRIHGAVIDELRRNDWAPRKLRRYQREIDDARDRFVGVYGRPPTPDELSQAVGISRRQLLKVQHDLARADVGSINAVISGEDDATLERIDTLPSLDLMTDPEHAAMRQVALERFREAFSELSPREREVAVLLHDNELTLREAGDLLGISESRVCQIHGRLKQRLRALLDAEDQLLRHVA